jgi:hypothetical protein
MKQGLVRYLLFLLAYVPIYVIVALKTIDDRIIDKTKKLLSIKDILINNTIPVSLFLFSFVLIVYFLAFSRLSLKPRGNPIFKIKTVKIQHKEYVTYLGTYILPFVSLQSKGVYDMVAILFMFLTIGYIFSKTNLIYTNPTLVFFGYDIYEIETEDGKIYDCISKDKFIIGERPSGIRLGENTYIIKKWKNNN